MGKFDEFENKPMACAVCEAMCPEAVDGTLSADEQRAFEKHVAGCVTCAQELEEAQRGAAWMAMLKGHTPEPPAALLQRILAETTGAQAAVAPVAAPVFAPTFSEPVLARPSGRSVQWAAMRAKLSEAFSLESFRFLLQPRLAMTAAMAFFSVALTLNMAGIRLTDLRAGVLRPSTLKRTLADAGASATRNFQNLPVVYKVESRVSEMRNNNDFERGFDRNDHRDPGGPFGPANEQKSPQQAAPQSAPDQNQQQEKTAPQSTPQGKSELELPVQPGTVARKGA